MPPLKVKPSVPENKGLEFRRPCNTVATSKFKIYSEKNRDSVAPNPSRTSLLTRKETSLANSTCLKDLPSGGMETKACHATRVDKTKIERKALADVSNVRGNASRLAKPGGSRIQPKASLSRAATVSHTSTKVSNKAMRNSSNFHGSQIHDTVVNIARGPSRDNITLTRKSMPVLKRDSQSGGSSLQGGVKSAEKATRKLGFPLKTRAGAKLVSQLSNLKSKAPKDRTSDGFIQRPPRYQTTKDAPQMSGRSIKLPVRTALRMSNAQRNFNSKSISKSDKSLGPTLGSATVAASSVTETSSRGSHEVSKGSFLVEGIDKVKPNTSGITANKKSNRRKSFTLSLISRSKVVGNKTEDIEQKLPNIDDQGNPLEVAEYVDDIYQYYWIMEAESASLENYMMAQTDVTPQMRGILVNWLIEVHLKFDLMPETLYLTVALLDRYLSLVPIKKKDFQLVGLASLLLASKYEDFWHPRVKDLISISAESYSRMQVLEMEKDILKRLRFRMNMPTPYVFMLRFLKAAQSDEQLEHLAFYLIELSLVEYEALKFRSSLLCASAVYVARCTLNKLPKWTPLLGKHAQYKESQIRVCAQMILKFHKAASKSLLEVTHDKYRRPEYCGVAAIKPLNSL